MSYKKSIKFKVPLQPEFDIADPKLTETINLRVTKAIYFHLKKSAEIYNIPMSEYARFLIEWHLYPSMILSNLIFGINSPKKAREDIADFKGRLHRLLGEIGEVSRIEKWAHYQLGNIERVEKEIEEVLSGITASQMQKVLEIMEKTDRDFTDVFLEKAKERTEKKKFKK